MKQALSSRSVFLLIGSLAVATLSIHFGSWQMEVLAYHDQWGAQVQPECGDGYCDERGGESAFGCDPVPGFDLCEGHRFCPEDCAEDEHVCATVDCAAPPQGCKYGDASRDKYGCPLNCGEVLCEAVCGNDKCEEGENGDNCSKDCIRVCPAVLCAKPPEGCWVVRDGQRDENGCLNPCGPIVCEDDKPECGNDICEEGEKDYYDPGGCGVGSDSLCLGPPARWVRGSCPTDCGEIDRCHVMDCQYGCEDGECIQPSPLEVCIYNGQKYHIGEQFKDDDGCNICTCEKNGSVSCSDRACPVDDDDDSGPREGYSSAYWQCYDGVEITEGSRSSCKTSATWMQYAEEGCLGHCSDVTGKCGVNTFKVLALCNDDDEQERHLFRYSKWECDDGSLYRQGGPTSCKPREVWEEYARIECEGTCDSDRCVRDISFDGACGDGEDDHQPPPPPPPPSMGRCLSNVDCPEEDMVCSVDFGDCQSPCPPDAAACPAVCAGHCMKRVIGHPDSLTQCDSTDQCGEGLFCTSEISNCFEDCPLEGVLCAKICSGRCVPDDLGREHGDGDDDFSQYQEGTNFWNPEFEDEVRTVPVDQQSRFSDVASDTLEGEAANALANQGVIGGFPDGSFGGEKLVNRAEAAKFLLKAKYGEVPDMQNNGQFLDVLEGEWYVKYVMAAAAVGAINGYPNGTFLPGESVNTAEFLKMLTKTFGLEQGLSHDYLDVPADIWFERYAGVAQEYDLFPGRPDGLLQPDRLLTRGEVAIAIFILLGLI